MTRLTVKVLKYLINNLRLIYLKGTGTPEASVLVGGGFFLFFFLVLSHLLLSI